MFVCQAIEATMVNTYKYFLFILSVSLWIIWLNSLVDKDELREISSLLQI